MSEPLHVICPTCHGRCTIHDPKYRWIDDIFRLYRIGCKTCNGTGWIAIVGDDGHAR